MALSHNFHLFYNIKKTFEPSHNLIVGENCKHLNGIQLPQWKYTHLIISSLGKKNEKMKKTMGKNSNHQIQHFHWP
jgi:hypothetical protein